MNAPAPTHGGQLNAIAARFNLDPATLLDFSAGINPDGPPLSVLSALRSALDNPATLFQYPDLEERRLRQGIATYTKCATDNITVANGFVPLLEAVIRSAKIRTCLLAIPSFAEYRRTLHNANVHVTPHILTAETSFHYNSPTLLEALTSDHHDALLLANPQNPSGTLHPRPELLRLVEATAKLGTRVLLDEAFIDYAPADSLVHHVDDLPNVTVFRSVTKFYGMPGLRVAYVVTNCSESQTLRDSLSPWAITTLASIGVTTALADTDFADEAHYRNRRRRESLRGQLITLGIYTYPASANFLLLRFPPYINTDSLWQRLIVDHRIVLRNCSNFEALPINHLRCAVRNEFENEKLLTALSSLLSPQHL
jgi:threonine-phosphate decarboxylase